MKAIAVKEKIHGNNVFYVAPFRKHIRKTTSHKHNNYFETVFLWKGRGKHFIDGKAYDIRPATVFILKKDQVHSWDITTEPEGFVLMVKDGFIAQLKDSMLRVMFHRFWGTECLYLKDYSTVRTYFQLLEEECASQAGYQAEIVEGLLKCILGKLLQLVPQHLPDSKLVADYSRFLGLLAQNKIPSRAVGEFAKALGVSSKYLNDTCLQTVGRPVKHLVTEFTLDEAKRYLQFTSHSVSEIAFRLNFQDPSYFVRFFRNHQGCTPLKFRKKQEPGPV